MAKNLSTRKPNFKNTRSHALNSTRKKQKLNKQTKKIDGVSVSLTAREWKTMNKAA